MLSTGYQVDENLYRSNRQVPKKVRRQQRIPKCLSVRSLSDPLCTSSRTRPRTEKVSSSFPSIPFPIAYTPLHISIQSHSDPILICPLLLISLSLQVSWPSLSTSNTYPVDLYSILYPSHTVTPSQNISFHHLPLFLSCSYHLTIIIRKHVSVPRKLCEKVRR